VREWESECEAGPVRVSATVRGGEVTALRSYVGGRWSDADAPVTDLGTVAAPAAAAWLLGIAERGTGEPAQRAIVPATLARGVTTWPVLLRLARDERRPRAVRQDAVFWVSQAAGEAATRGLNSLVDERDADLEVRERAVFALSQRPADESVPALVRIARTNESPRLRQRAIFWLGQSTDPRALAFLEELLLGR
jgi:HEAT repeat protein